MFKIWLLESAIWTIYDEHEDLVYETAHDLDALFGDCFVKVPAPFGAGAVATSLFVEHGVGYTNRSTVPPAHEKQQF